jgi:hypothetical protein
VTIQALLESAGSSTAKIASASVILADEEDFAEENESGCDGSRRIRPHGAKPPAPDRLARGCAYSEA